MRSFRFQVGARIRQTVRRFALLAVGWCVLGCSSNEPKQPTQENPSTPTASPATITAAEVAELNRGVGLMGQYDYDKARKVFAQLNAARPDWSAAKLNLAIATLNLQQPENVETAKRLCQEIPAADAHHIRAEYCLGILELFQGRADGALGKFRDVTAADADDPFCHYFIGQCLFQLEQFEPALVAYRRARELDPYLQSAYYGELQALQRLDRGQESDAAEADFSRLNNNPRSHLANIANGRLGVKAQCVTADLSDRNAAQPNATSEPLFSDPATIPLKNTDGYQWNRAAATPGESMSITVCDIDGDVKLDLFIARGLAVDGQTRNAVLLNQGEKFFVDLEHPLAKVTDVNAALWGDFDNDGLTDVYLCRAKGNQLWRQTKPNAWEDVTEKSRAAGDPGNTIDGAWVDADHDGDLDLFLIRDRGPNQLLINRLDGTFEPAEKAKDVCGWAAVSRGLAVADLDRDRDVDFMVLKEGSPHEIFLNDRLWAFHPAKNAQEFTRNADLRACVVADLGNAAGQTILSLDGKELTAWTPKKKGGWKSAKIADAKITAEQSPQIALADVSGTGSLASIVTADGAWKAVSLDERHTSLYQAMGTRLACWTIANLDAARGPAVIGVRQGEPPLIWQPGRGRKPFAAVAISGKTAAGQTRSNRSGIGVGVAARTDSQWTVLDTHRQQSGPGQSLQPLAIGMNGHAAIDFLRLDWPDGVMQTELSLALGKLHRIEETQRQTSSCPVVFAWNGREWTFITDVLGVGGLGFWAGPNEYVPAVPRESLLLPDNALQPRDGRWKLKICEPMEEVCYLDSVALVGYDLPPGWQMTLDERMNVSGAAATGEPRFFRRALPIAKAENERGDDVTELLAHADHRAPEPGDRDPRFIGLTKERSLTLQFSRPLDAGPGRPMLVIDGWIEYPYSQTVFAAWQAGEAYRAPSLEAKAKTGEWKMIAKEWGYPAGMPRQMSLPLVDLPSGTTELRLSTNQEIYWDRIFVAWAEACPEAKRTEIPLAEARLAECGFPKRTTLAQHRPHYDYERRSSQWDTRHPAGWYTRLGRVEELLSRADDALVIFGPGEEVELEFADALPKLPSDGSRRLVLEQRGWCKDMDLYTKDGETVAPLPTRDDSSANKSVKDELHRRYNTRYRAGAD